MSRPTRMQHLTEVQTISLLPDQRIGSWSSEARKALQAGLRTTASHPKCHGIYWLEKMEDQQKIVIISKWTEAVDFITSRSYLRPLLPHLASPPPRSIHVNHTIHSLSSYSLTNFLTVYFPLRNCSAKFKLQIADSVHSFVMGTESSHGKPDSLRAFASGWVKENKIVDGEVASGFMFCLMWTDRESEERFKGGNEHWSVLMRYLGGMGMLGEDQFHGKAYQVLGEGQKERFEFSDDSSDDGEDVDELLELMRERLKKLVPTCSPQFPGSDAPLEKRLATYCNEDEVKLCENPGLDPWSRCDWQATEGEDSDDESLESTPILTPSSSTMSLNSLFDNSESMGNLPGTWKSEYDISHTQQAIEATPLADIHWELEDGNIHPIPPTRKTWYELSSEDEDKSAEGDLAMEEASVKLLAHLTTISPASSFQQSFPAPERPHGLQCTDSPGKVPNSRHDEKTTPDLIRRYGGPKLDPEEELRNAKSRFWRRGAPPSPPSLIRQPATLRERSVPDEPSRRAQRVLTIDPLRSGRPEARKKGTWWAYVKNCLSNTNTGSMPRADVDDLMTLPSFHIARVRGVDRSREPKMREETNSTV